MIKSIAILLIVSGALSATTMYPVYTGTPCDGPDQVVCSITSASHASTAEEMAGITNSMFQSFFADVGYGYADAIFNWGGAGTGYPDISNANGYVVGIVGARNNFNTQYVYHDGQITCCFADYPYWTLNDINDNNLAIGHYNGLSFLLDASQTNPEPFYPISPAGPYAYWAGIFHAIDNQNRILFQPGTGTQYYMLEPVATPEPGTFWLLGTALVGGALLARRKKRK